ncbi:MAG TPA: IS3 family transposase, partial [Clostridiales bacterium UBA8153]|nr:IS3 family transposase [Clostridiales bacterium UBA8153]
RCWPGVVPEELLLAAVQEVIAERPFGGEGHRKLWARLRRHQGMFASRQRVLRVMREHALLAPLRRVHRHSDGRHDGTIIPEAPHRLCGTDATRVEAERDGWGWV